MKKFLSGLAFTLFFQSLEAQNDSKNFEFGSTLLTVNWIPHRVYGPGRTRVEWKPQFEWMNGLFFRYTKNRTGLRIMTSYFENHSTYIPPPGSQDAPSTVQDNKDFRMGGGVQFSPINKIKGFFIYGDLLYRHLESKGHNDGGFSGSHDFRAIRNGVDCFLGLGYRLRILKKFYVSAETAAHIYSGVVNYSSRSLQTGKTSEYSFTDASLSLTAKLHLTVAF